MNPTSQFWRDPQMPYVESRRACDSRANYRMHNHPSFSIGAVDQGTSIFTGADHEPVTLSPGSLVFVPAQYAHACNPTPDAAWSYQMLHLQSEWVRQVRQESGYGNVPFGRERIWVTRDAGIYARFGQLNTLLFSGTTPAVKEAALIEFLGELDEREGLYAISDEVMHAPDRLASVFDHLEAHLQLDIPLGELAAMAGMSRYQLIRSFRKQTGLTPHAWQLNQRINLARGLIRDGKNIADIAYALGFSDQSHFQRVFKAHTGVTPGSYRC